MRPVRAAAASRLCELWPERRVLGPLSEALTDVDDGVAHAAAVSLVRIGPPALPGLVEGVPGAGTRVGRRAAVSSRA